MKVKEVQLTANITWSPAKHYPILIAAGTAAQQLDATFSTNAKLDILSLNLAEGSYDMPVISSLEVPQRLHSLLWTSQGMDTEGSPSGFLVGGSDGGNITVWNASSIINGVTDTVMCETTNHTGAVRCLDVNPFQPNLLVSGASESEIYIWDLNNPTTPMSPGNKTQASDDIVSVAWNRQVQYIVASASPNGRCVVWDLRKNQPLITVSDTSARIRCKAIEWHPDIPTQMVLASEEDRAPVMQLWDLRFAASPVKMFERHEKGILSIAWCPQDSELLLSAGKDNNIYCWNPNSEEYGGEVVYEVPSTSQWCFDVQWCPRHPGLISTASFDGHICVYSLLGGRGPEDSGSKSQPNVPVDPSDPFSGIGSRPVQKVTEPLKKPPKWLRRPCAARFGFGGKLVSFGPSAPTTVSISQVTTEVDFVDRSEALQSALGQGDFSGYCAMKMENASTKQEKNIWEFMKVTFEGEPRQQFLQLLGYNTEELEQKLWEYIGKPSLPSAAAGGELDVSALSQKMEDLATSTVIDDDFNLIDISSSPTQPSETPAKFNICTNEDIDSQLSRALLVGSFEAAVEVCLKEDRMADALVLAVAGGSELFSKTQQVFFDRNQSKVKRLMSAVVNRNWNDIATNANLENWREVLAALVTFAGPEDFAPLCDLLGNRMEREESGAYSEHACLCYICSGNVDKFIDCWKQSTDDCCSPEALQDLVEKVVLLKKAVEKERRQQKETTHPFFVEKLCLYATLLASQGNLMSAYSYLKHTTGTESDLLRDRLYHAQGYKSELGVAPATPFQASIVDNVSTMSRNTFTQPTSSTHATGGGVYGSNMRVTTSYPQGTHYGGQVPPSSSYPPTQPLPTQTTMSTQHSMSTYPITSQPLPGNIQTGAPYNYPQPPPVSQPQIQPGIPSYAPSSSLPPIQGSPDQTRKSNEPLSYMYRKDQVAWNDPPMLVKSDKPKTPSSTAVLAPIVAPVSNVQMTVPTDTGPAVMVPTSSAGFQDDQPKVTTPVTPQAPEPPVQKAPIPAEYVAMVTTFDNMAQRLKSAAVNQALKRKVDDVNKKLEALQDLLRENKLSQSTIQGLAYISQAIESRSYQQGLDQYNAMVTTASFSEIGSFIPGIKVLLQLGLQLKI